MEIKRCTISEIEALAKLAAEIWHEYFTSIITEEQINYMVEMYQSKTALTKAITEEHYTYFLAYQEGRLIGYCGVKPEAGRVFLSKLYLHRDYRGKGLSSSLLNQAIQFTQERNKQAIYLTCNKYNANSLEMYAAKGFYKIDDVQTDIGRGFIMDDYVLQLDV